VPQADREAWLYGLRRENERQEDASPTAGDAYWEQTDDTHRAFVERFLTMLPAGGSVLDAACGIGRYVGTVLATGRSVLAVDASAIHLAGVRASFPGATTEQHDLQDLPYRDRFDGVLCVDAMEFVPPEDWPRVLERLRDALHRPGRLYLTVELVPSNAISAGNDAARAAGHPVVEGEVLWEMSEDSPGYYHYYPGLEQVRVWLTASGFDVVDEREGPWHDDEYAYHHLLAQTTDRGAARTLEHARPSSEGCDGLGP
jgi:SAM-dependent methyltransferase